MTATTAWMLVLLNFCNGSVTSFRRMGMRRSSSSYYTPPVCGNSNFYCPGSPNYHCVARSERCTGDAQSTMCRRKTYEYCNYDTKTGKFEVLRYSTNLRGSFSGIKKIRISPRLEHQFIVYRGLMYEFGSYGSRVQDPNDPNYEYGPDRRASRGPIKLGLSSCTYEQVQLYVTTWTIDHYHLLNNNCQDFVKCLEAHLIDNCSSCPSQRCTVKNIVWSKHPLECANHAHHEL